MSSSEINLGTVALVGAPNSGKTTLYNWLTGSHAKAVNYPGSTVDYLKGSLASHWRATATVVDTPGTYTLQAKTEDELVTKKILTDPQFELKPDRIIVVIDGTQIRRHLLLAEQVRVLGLPMVIVVTMLDLLKSQKLSLNLEPLKKHIEAPVIAVDGRLGGGLRELLEALPQASALKSRPRYEPWTDEELESQSVWAEQLAEQVLPQSQGSLADLWNSTLKWDRILLHPVLGLVLFFAIMSTLFSSLYFLADPLMGAVEATFSWASESLLALNPENLILSFLADGILASFGSVLVFVPQIFILFVGFGLLESSGYLARAATLIDRPFSFLGLSGRSFVPFLSGYACAVPALMAARNINSSRERWIARLIIPLLSCSARLPVYGLLLGFLFWGESSWKPGLTLAAIYLVSMVVSALAAGVLHRLIPKDKRSFFLMELPLYRRPVIKVLMMQAWMKTRSFITRAGPVIFILTILLWVGMTFPNSQESGVERIQTSYLGQVGQKIEPVFQPMGLDWRGGLGLMAAFAAREVFVSTLAVVYSVGEEVPESGLLEALQGARFSDGQLVYTTSVVWGLIVFFMIALQCLSTVGMMIQESGSWRLALVQLLVFNLVAYAAAVGVVQGLRALGVS